MAKRRPIELAFNQLKPLDIVEAKMISITCPFCGENFVATSMTINKTFACPRCGVAMTFTTKVDNVRCLLAKSVLGGDSITWEEARRIEIVIIPDVSLGTSPVYLAVGWDPEEMLNTREVARILGITPRRVAHMAEEGKFPGAVKIPSRRGQRGFWRIPRRDIMKRKIKN
ncbi:MAG: helix-turn-helix domain-containing protein [Candidatus Bathyarchaeia archaeon]